MEARATRRARRQVERGRCIGCGRAGATLKHVDERGVVDQRLAVRGKRLAVALHDRELRGEFRIDVRLADRNAVDQAFVILFRRAQRCAAAVRDAGSNHNGVVLVEVNAAATKLVVQHLEGELDRAQHILAPRAFGILLRVGLLEGESVGRCRTERHSLLV